MYTFRLSFGKYKGVPLDQVPSDYLTWLLQNLRALSPAVRDAIAGELQARAADEGPCPKCGAVAGQFPTSGDLSAEQVQALFHGVFRKLALVCHPDRGGTTAAMAALNEVREEIVERLAEVTAS